MSQSPAGVWCDWVGCVERANGWGQDFKENTELRHSAFSRAESAVVPFEVREGERTPETDSTRCQQVLKEGDKFQSSVLRLVNINTVLICS